MYWKLLHSNHIVQNLAEKSIYQYMYYFWTSVYTKTQFFHNSYKSFIKLLTYHAFKVIFGGLGGPQSSK